MIRFGRFAHRDARLDGRTRPETFDFLGFTHIMALDWLGKPRLIRRTSRKKRNAKLASLRRQMRKRRHDPPREQYAWLSSVLRGHYGYYGVPSNFVALAVFYQHVRLSWHRSLQRRSQRARWTRERRAAFEARFALPQPRITRPPPRLRPGPVPQRWEPGAGNPLAGLGRPEGAVPTGTSRHVRAPRAECARSACRARKRAKGHV